VIDRQIAAASSTSSKNSKKRLPEPGPERNAKKHKVDYPEAKVDLHKAKPRVIITYGRGDKRGAISLTRQSPTHKTLSGKVKQEEEVGDAVTQPRANNGRFAKKSKSTNVPPVLNNPFLSSSQKRRSEEVGDLEESPRKKSAHADKEDEEVVRVQKVIRRGFYALFSKPNPQQFALKAWSNKAWSNHMVPDDSSVSSEDDSHLLTPEDNISSRPDIVGPAEAGMINRFTHPMARASLSCINPSPLAFAKNRWNSFGQATSKRKLSPRRLSLDELHVSEAEPAQEDASHCPPPSDDCPSDTESIRSHYRQTYPVLSPSAVHRPCIPKGTRFFSASTETKTTLVNAGWDDASDSTEL